MQKSYFGFPLHNSKSSNLQIEYFRYLLYNTVLSPFDCYQRYAEISNLTDKNFMNKVQNGRASLVTIKNKIKRNPQSIEIEDRLTEWSHFFNPLSEIELFSIAEFFEQPTSFDLRIKKILNTPISNKIYGVELPTITTNRLNIVAFIRSLLFNGVLAINEICELLEKLDESKLSNLSITKPLTHYTKVSNEPIQIHSGWLSGWEYRIGKLEHFEVEEYFNFHFTREGIKDKFHISALFQGMGIPHHQLDKKYQSPINPYLLKEEKKKSETFFKNITQIISKSEPMPQPSIETINSNPVDILQNSIGWSYSELKSMLDEVVIGQEEAKSDVLLAFYQHQLRMAWTNTKSSSMKPVELPKSNVLLVGPTGSGKTLIVETTANLMNIPYLRIDCSSLVCSGYIGVNLSDCILKLIEQAGSTEKAQEGIVFFDEFDKLSSYKTGYESIGTIELQQEFLSLVEGKNFNYYQRKSNNDLKQGTFDASNVLFIFGGSFGGIDEIVSKKNQVRIGFTKSDKFQEKTFIITSQDLIDYGIMPELVGRIGSISMLHPLKKEDLVQVILNSEKSPLQSYLNFFELSCNKLIIEKDVFDLIADDLIGKKLGARYISTVFQTLFKEYQKKALLEKNQTYRIDSAYYQFVFKN